MILYKNIVCSLGGYLVFAVRAIRIALATLNTAVYWCGHFIIVTTNESAPFTVYKEEL